MSALGNGLLFAGFAVLGAGVVTLALTVRPEPLPVAPDGTPVPVWVRADCPDEVDLGPRLEALEREVGEARLLLGAERGQEEAAVGAAIPWPDDLPDGFDEDAVSGALLALADAGGGAVAGLDCGEYPCVAVVAFGGEGSLDALNAFEAGLRETYPSVRRQSSLHMRDGGGVRGYSVALALPAAALDEEQGRRVEARFEELDDLFDVGAALDESAGAP